MAFDGSPGRSTLNTTLVGDHVVMGGTPTVAALLEGGDRGIFGYSMIDSWSKPAVQAMWIDGGN